MTSYKNFVAKVKQGRILPAYTDLLIDINHCLNMFSDLEMERSLGEMFSDYFGSERGTINFVELYTNLRSIKKEIELGSSLLKILISKTTLLIQLKGFYRNQSQAIEFGSNHCPSGLFPNSNVFEILNSKFEMLCVAVENLQIPSENTSYGARTRAIGLMVNFGIVYKRTGNRSEQYHQAKRLYDSLNNIEILNMLKEVHVFISEVIRDIDSATKMFVAFKQYLRKEDRMKTKPSPLPSSVELPMLELCNPEEK